MTGFREAVGGREGMGTGGCVSGGVGPPPPGGELRGSLTSTPRCTRLAAELDWRASSSWTGFVRNARSSRGKRSPRLAGTPISPSPKSW